MKVGKFELIIGRKTQKLKFTLNQNQGTSIYGFLTFWLKTSVEDDRDTRKASARLCSAVKKCAQLQ